MDIGVPREIKDNERRVALTAAGVTELTRQDHTVVVEAGAGVGSGVTDDAYREAGAEVVDTAEEVWERADLLLKVKELVGEELERPREGQVIFTYLHLAASADCAKALLDSGATSIAYEMVERSGPHGRTFPLLAPMSQVAGRMAPLEGAHHLMMAQGGSGVLLSGVPGTRAARVAVIGGGVAGEHAALVASGLGAQVTVLDVNLDRLAALEVMHGSRVRTLASNHASIAETVADADLVIGSVLIPGAAAPKLVTEEMVEAMRPGSVLVDIAIDQGGCFAVSKPTTHQEPTFTVGDKVVYAVANMPGAVPQSSTAALTNATLPYITKLANKGWKDAIAADRGFAAGLSTTEGTLQHSTVVDSLEEPLNLDRHTVLRPVKDVLSLTD
ncbi:MAG: alanine dehydrogenase [Micrococcus sp.]|nr:alanine dehydrogenase [Micrococcus sp.]